MHDDAPSAAGTRAGALLHDGHPAFADLRARPALASDGEARP